MQKSLHMLLNHKILEAQTSVEKSTDQINRLSLMVTQSFCKAALIKQTPLLFTIIQTMSQHTSGQLVT